MSQNDQKYKQISLLAPNNSKEKISKKTPKLEKFSFSDQEINQIESLFGFKNGAFNKERKKFIRCKESIDIKACAGSGKTTALVAKLILLEKNYLPLKENRGVCVLTHTNVAIDAIKSKLGPSAKILNYPNFIGTIQSFVDYFLAIPSYLKTYHERPRVDNDLSHYLRRKKFNELCEAEKKEFYTASKKHQSVYKYIDNIRYSFKNNNYVYGLASRRPIASDSRKPRYQKLEKIYGSVIKEDRVISYDDAYSLALDYIEKYNFLTNLFCHRFQYIFLDEMQDTSRIQTDILNQLFPRDKTIIQRIGDPNQTIFGSESDSGYEWKPRGSLSRHNPLAFSKSLRFGDSIAFCIKNICIQPDEKMVGNAEKRSLRPHFFLYKKGNEKQVIEKFTKLIKNNESSLNIKVSDKIKIIGWVSGLDDKKTTINSYYPDFDKQTNLRNRKTFDTIDGYTKSGIAKFKQTNNLKDITEGLLDFFTKCLQVSEIKIPVKKQLGFPTASRIINFFEENKENLENKYDQFRSKLVQFTFKTINYDPDFVNNIKQYVKDEFLPLFNKNADLVKLAPLFRRHTEERSNAGKSISKTITTNIVDKIDGTPIIAATVHSIKGETHKATLYLETKYKKKDISSLIEYFVNKKPSGEILDEIKRKLRMVYVGLSRPSHLLAVAANEEKFNEEVIRKLKETGWQVLKICN